MPEERIERLKEQHLKAAVAVVSCHISDLVNDINPNEPEGLHSRDTDLEDKLMDLARAMLELMMKEGYA